MMNRNSCLSRSNDGKRNSRWSHGRGWAQGASGYMLVPDTDLGDGDNVPLRNYKDEVCLEKQLQPGDTLQSLALEFNCSTAELKRVNRILNANEIFALRVVKIPTRCYSLLTERLPSVHTAACTLSDSSTAESQAAPVDLHTPIAPSHDAQAAGDATGVVCLLNGEVEDGLSPPYPTEAGESPAHYDGADWGFSWLVLLVGVLILGFVGPLLYVLYITLIVHKKKT